jgi:hypothetical protein
MSIIGSTSQLKRIGVDEYPAVELWQPEYNALPLFEAAFDRPTCLESIAAPLPG